MTANLSPEDRDIIDTAARSLFSKRVEEVTLMELNELSDVCDHYLVGTCKSEAQLKATINAVARALKSKLGKPLAIDYRHGDRWAVLDFGNLMVHLFEDEYRKQISLERLWADAEKTPLNEADYQMLEEETENNDDDILEENEYL